ncbi:hypothetical protein [Rubrobacter tropicus]|nr:hypothetical protein [Rubrobacter tropicus]
MRKSDLLDGLDDRSGPDPPPRPRSGSAAWKLAWAVVGAVFFFVLVHVLT